MENKMKELINLIEEKIMREKMTIKESIIYIFKIKQEIKEVKQNDDKN